MCLRLSKTTFNLVEMMDSSLFSKELKRQQTIDFLIPLEQNKWSIIDERSLSATSNVHCTFSTHHACLVCVFLIFCFLFKHEFNASSNAMLILWNFKVKRWLTFHLLKRIGCHLSRLMLWKAFSISKIIDTTNNWVTSVESMLEWKWWKK